MINIDHKILTVGIITMAQKHLSFCKEKSDLEEVPAKRRFNFSSLCKAPTLNR